MKRFDMFWQQISYGNGRNHRTVLTVVLALMLSFGMAFQNGFSFHASASDSRLAENGCIKPVASTTRQIHIGFISVGQGVNFQDQTDPDFSKTSTDHCQNTSCPFITATFIPCGFNAHRLRTSPIINSMMRAKTDTAPLLSPPRHIS